jgi:hypothetical protein
VGATQYAELNGLLDELVATARRVFCDDLVGVYLTGSFAVGDADLNSDCDFLVVVRHPVTTEQERELRVFHDEMPTRDGFWTHHLEGSYALLDDLAALDRIGRDWLYIDHGHREMEWSDHCNREVVRWSLRERGVALEGPRPDSFVAPIPPDSIRARMLADLPTLTEDILAWAPRSVAWSQRYLVTTYCRVLYSAANGEVASKRQSLIWAEHNLDARWQPLLRQVREDRDLGWDVDDPPRPGSFDEALDFAAWCRGWAFSRFA